MMSSIIVERPDAAAEEAGSVDDIKSP